LRPDYAEAHQNLAGMLAKMGDLEGAVAEYRIALQLNPDKVEAQDSLGGVLRAKGEVEQAIAEHRTALRLNPDRAETHYNLGFALYTKGDVQHGPTDSVDAGPQARRHGFPPRRTRCGASGRSSPPWPDSSVTAIHRARRLSRDKLPFTPMEPHWRI
jgi:tetratricopeptide (TPR) repeat protein